MFQQKEPYDKLWNTVKQLIERNDQWLNGLVIIFNFILE